MIDRLKQALEGRYAIDREIGEGGMAIVYLATDVRHHRKVALKVLRPELAATMGPERFLQEVRVTANLQHPHILPLFDSGEADGFLYYVMPFLEGESLRDRVAREGELPVGEAIRILKEVVDALAAAHAAGVVHRDIKPDNVMLSGRHAVVTDFGVAKAVSEAAGHGEHTTKGVALGTPTYMAPEQAAANENVDHRADIYAVGAMGYELLAGRPPFSGRTAQQVLAAHVTEVPRPVSELRSAVPESVAAVIMRCLEKTPADRWQTANELHAQLETFATPTTGVTPAHTAPVSEAAAGVPGWMKIAAPMTLVAAAGVVWFASQGEGGGSDDGSDVVATVDPAETFERLVVMPFRNLTTDPELDVWASLAADQISRAVDIPRPIPVVPATTVATTVRGLGEEATTETVANAVRARYAFAGTVAEAGGQLRFDLELLDVQENRLLRSLPTVAGPPDRADSLVSSLASQAATLAVAYLDPDAPVWIAEMTPPVSIAAFEALLEAGEIFCTGDNRGALEPARRATELSPGFATAMILLMVAHSNLGEDFQADSLIDELNLLRDGITRSERLQVDWMMGNRYGDPGLSSRAAAELFEIDPVGQGASAMLTAYRMGRMEEAIRRLDMMDPNDPCQWPGAYTQGAVAYHALERYEEELALVQRGLTHHPGNRAMMDRVIRAHIGMGRIEAVDSVLAVIDGLPPTDSDANFRPLYAGLELRAHGYDEEGAQLIERVLDNWTPNRPRLNNLWNHARALNWGGRWSEAEPILRGLIEEFPDNAAYLREYGVALARQGRVAEARVASDRLGAMTGRLLTGDHFWGQGLIAAVLGEQAEAVRLIQLSFANGRLIDSTIHWEPALTEMWDYPPFAALVAPR